MNRTEWLKKYPKHCRRCEARTDSTNPCSGCLLDGNKCPRCMKSGTLHEWDAAQPCSSCGWVETEEHEYGAPLSRQEKARIKQREAEDAERDRTRRIVEAHRTLQELGAE